MPERNYSKRETDAYRANMVSEMGKQSGMLDKIFEQTQRTNGRVTKLEDKTEDYPEVKKSVTDVSTWKKEFMAEIRGMKRIMVVLVIVLPSLISTIFILYISNLKRTIVVESAANVITTLEQKYNLKIEK